MGHVLTFVGDVATTDTRSGTGAYMTLVDRTTSEQVRISCPEGPLKEFAEKAKVGQVIVATGWARTAARSLSYMTVPLVVRAQSGTNEAELNDLSDKFIRQLAEALSGEELRKARDQVAHFTAQSEARARLIAGRDAIIEELQKQLEYEKLLNGAIQNEE